MIFSLLSSGAAPLELLLTLLLTLPGMMLALSVHETAHGYVAWKCGDNTARNLGRLTLNPLKHLDPVGFICLLIFGYGWAKPVPINTRNFRNPKKGMAISALAGPLSNLILGLIFAVLTGICWGFARYYTIPTNYGTDVAATLGVPILPSTVRTALLLLTDALHFTAHINFVYMAFNMIPVPPFDGSRVLLYFLPPRVYFGIMRYERQIMIGAMVGIMLLSNLGLSPFGWIASELTELVYLPISKGIFNILI